MPTVRYLVNDVARAVDFYTRRLGFELIEQYGPAMAIVSREGLNLWLAGPPSSAARAMPDGRKPEPGGWNRIVVETSDIDAHVAGLRDTGVGFRNEIVAGPGGRQVLVEDGEGNVVELFEPAR